VIPTDVGDPEQVFAAADLVERELGPIDIWINNAMTTVFGRVEQIAPVELRRVTDVTYHGYVWGTQAALRVMRPRDRGTIVQVGSALAHRAIPLQSAYCAAKHAIRAFTESLRSELIHDRSRVHLTMVQLPAVNTPQFHWCENKLGIEPRPIAPIYQPELVADSIFYAAHHRRREVIVGGSTLRAVLGQKLIPGLLDRYLARIGFQGQSSGIPVRRATVSNLFAPVPGDHGAHGYFELHARVHDPIARVGVRLGATAMQAAAAALAFGVIAGAIYGIRRLRRC
jgi:short-subunit dehydrogenase